MLADRDRPSIGSFRAHSCPSVWRALARHRAGVSAVVRRLLITLAGALCVACARERSRRTDSAAGRMAASESVAVPVAMPAALPPVPARPILWSDSTVLSRLSDAGLAVTVRRGAVTERYLGPPGTALIARTSTGDSAEILTFVYAGAAAAGRDIVQMDTARVAPRTVRVAWRAPATLVTDNNLVAIVVTADAALSARVAQALSSQRAQ